MKWASKCRAQTGSNPSLSARQTKKPQRKLGLFCLCGEQTDENPHGSTGASNAGEGTSERSDDGPRLVQPRARRKAPSNPPLPDNEGPWRKLGLFRLCGEPTVETPNGSTGASTAGAGTSDRSDDGPRWVQPRARRKALNNPSVSASQATTYNPESSACSPVPPDRRGEQSQTRHPPQRRNSRLHTR